MPFVARIRIGRWPRRLAAMSCLLLAVLAAEHRPDAATASGSVTGLARGQRAVPVTVQGDPHPYLRLGDVVELLAPPRPSSDAPVPPGASATAVAPAARVLSMQQGDELSVTGSAQWQLVVAVDEATARRLAAQSGQPLLAVTGRYP